MTPVPTVAMDCGLLESRLDRLAASGPVHANTAAVFDAAGLRRWFEVRLWRGFGSDGSIEREDMMGQTFIGRKRVRKFFGKIEEVAEMPNLIEVQKASYDQFLLVQEPQGGRPNEGMQAVFKSVFPISDFSNTSMLEFVKYEFEPPKYDVDEC